MDRNILMANTSTSKFDNGLQQNNIGSTLDYISQNGSTTITSYPSVTEAESNMMIGKQSKFFTPASNRGAFYSAQIIAQTPQTILITNNLSPQETGLNNSFTNRSVRIARNNNKSSIHGELESNFHQIRSTSTEEPQCTMTICKNQLPFHHLHHLHHQQSTLPFQPTTNPTLVKSSSSGITNTPTVVLDRINICINNHFGDLPKATAISQSDSLLSPIISPIVSQHTTIIEATESSRPAVKQTDTSTEIQNEEPDSTTWTHCQSETITTEHDYIDKKVNENDIGKTVDCNVHQEFVVGEDAFVKRLDGRYYLGSVSDKHRQQYLVKFDDKTDYWSNADELTKLTRDLSKPTCLSCKLVKEHDVVEKCERCGRGYHRLCTNEILPKSGLWMCKKCAKPMKYTKDNAEKLTHHEHIRVESTTVNIQFPYALEALTWDEKHRVNLEQIYCYCGKSGQFDNNMLQCCKCKQWFHNSCLSCIDTLYRGDVFFLFGCAVCNKGKEFLRRIELQWVDLIHLLLYNISIMKNFQKYHHLHSEIYPFALSRRKSLQLPSSMQILSDQEFKTNLLSALQGHPELFLCGREIKKDASVWGLRKIKPPQALNFKVGPDEVLCDRFIKEELKLNVFPLVAKEEYKESKIKENPKICIASQSFTKKIKENEDDDEKFTSDDEIPIQQIIEKKKCTFSCLESNNIGKGLNDQFYSNGIFVYKNKTTEKNESCEKVFKKVARHSCKRKQFTISKEYNLEKLNDLSVQNLLTNEKSISSPGTLDLIIPPPKNFLGENNPFRMLPYEWIENSAIEIEKFFFKNTSQNDLYSKQSTSKSSRLIPNISSSDFVKSSGQPKNVRTIKRRLSAKDVMLAPNQEVRRRRTKRISSNIEVNSTTNFNPIPKNFFPVHATIPVIKSFPDASLQSSIVRRNSSVSSHSKIALPITMLKHDRRLRKRPDKNSSRESQRNLTCGSLSLNSFKCSLNQKALPPHQQKNKSCDLQQSVNEYFSTENRIAFGEKFIIRAKRRLISGQNQYLFEWDS